MPLFRLLRLSVLLRSSSSCSPLHVRPSCSPLVGHQEAGLCPLLPRRADGLPHCGAAAPLPRLLLGVHGRGVLPPQTGEENAKTKSTTNEKKKQKQTAGIFVVEVCKQGQGSMVRRLLMGAQADDVTCLPPPAGHEARELQHPGAGRQRSVGVHALQASGEVAAQEDPREDQGTSGAALSGDSPERLPCLFPPPQSWQKRSHSLLSTYTCVKKNTQIKVKVLI